MSRRRFPLLVVVVVLSAVGCSRVYRHEHPVCGPRSATRLLAESVPGAALVPCVRSLPVGWRFSGFEAVNGRATFSLDSDSAGERAVEISFVASCSPTGRSRTSSVDGATRSVDVRSVSPYRAIWTDTFDGGCVRYRLAFDAGARTDRLVAQLERALWLIPRARLS